MWLQAGNETTPRRLPIYQHQITRNQVCVLAAGRKLSRFFYDKTLTDIVSASCYENDLQFPREILATRAHTYFRWKLVRFFFLQFPKWKLKFAEIRAGLLCRNQSRDKEDFFAIQMPSCQNGRGRSFDDIIWQVPVKMGHVLFKTRAAVFYRV